MINEKHFWCVWEFFCLLWILIKRFITVRLCSVWGEELINIWRMIHSTTMLEINLKSLKINKRIKFFSNSQLRNLQLFSPVLEALQKWRQLWSSHQNISHLNQTSLSLQRFVISHRLDSIYSFTLNWICKHLPTESRHTIICHHKHTPIGCETIEHYREIFILHSRQISVSISNSDNTAGRTPKWNVECRHFLLKFSPFSLSCWCKWFLNERNKLFRRHTLKTNWCVERLNM